MILVSLTLRERAKQIKVLIVVEVSRLSVKSRSEVIEAFIVVIVC
jgi:hypothetical protein